MSKQLIRQRLLDQRQQLDDSIVVQWSATVQESILDSAPYVNAESLALYASFHNEVRTDRLLTAALFANKQVCYPRLENGRIVFVEVAGVEDLATGHFGVLEPQGKKVVAPEKLNLILVPGVGFDRRGNRIGYGFGYYDRVLVECCNAEFVGMAYTFQVVERLEEEKHDIRLDYLATECEMFEFKHKQEHLKNGGRT